MEEIKLLKELGLDEHLRVAGYALLFSFIVKTLYESHIQQLFSDTKRIFERLTGKISETFKPSLYEILPDKGQKVFDIIEAIWNYFVSIVALVYFVVFIILSKYIDWSNFDIEKGIIYFGSLIVFLTLSLASVANGNKAVLRIKGKR